MEFKFPLPENFSTTINGKKVELFCLQNDDFKVFITNYGARIVGLFTRDKNGNFVDTLIGPDTIQDFLQCQEKFYGAIVGRCCNRIANSEFEIENKKYFLTKNKGEHHLHGGDNGFHTQIWEVEESSETRLVLSYFSKDLEEGYPGNLKVKVYFSLSQKTELEIKIEAETDKTTVVNMTSHPFFNLNGEGSILNHKLWIAADSFTPVNESVTTTGEIRNLDQSPLDFRVEKTIGKDIDNNDEQLIFGTGYDHNLVLRSHNISNCIAKAKGDISGIVLKIYTQEKGIQLYTGNWMSGENSIKNNQKDRVRTAFCLETQNFPNAVNYPQFPSVLLQPNDKYTTQTRFQFSVDAE